MRFLTLAAGMLLLAPEAGAQIRASEPATISQVIDGDTLTVTYSRPRIRDRSTIYGEEVTWGEVWTPGANWATTLEVTRDVSVNGHPLPKGKYSVWMEVQKKEWTVLFDTTARRFHTNRPKPDSALVRFTVVPDKVKGPEVLTWSFPSITTTGATLQMAWAGRSVSLRIAVPPSAPVTIDSVAVVPFLGRYAFRWGADDTTGTAMPDTTGPKPDTWTAMYRNRMLIIESRGATPDESWEAAMVSVGLDGFYPIFLEDGELYDAVSSIVAEFEVEDGRATGLVVRNQKDAVIGRGRRID